MSQLRIWLIASIVLLLGSNAMWAMRFAKENAPQIAPSYGCTETEQFQQIREELIQPIAAAVNASLVPGTTKNDVLAVLAGPQPSEENLTCVIPSDTHIGPFGLRFAGERLVAVSTTVCMPSNGP